MKKNILTLSIILFFISCTYNETIATIKNNSSNVVGCIFSNSKITSDEFVYNDTTYKQYLIQPQKYDNYSLLDSNLNKAPNSAKKYIYIFDIDSLDKFKNRKSIKGILKRSLLKAIVIQLNRAPLDTIYVR